MTVIHAYKMFHVRRDGTIGPLFIDRSLVVPEGEWIRAKAIRKDGFAFRPGFHAVARKHAPHLSLNGYERREWREVLIRGFKEHMKPKAQGGLWYTAKEMLVLPK